MHGALSSLSLGSRRLMSSGCMVPLPFADLHMATTAAVVLSLCKEVQELCLFFNHGIDELFALAVDL